jgi:hypothetical protein
MPQALRDQRIALILLALPVAIILLALGVGIFGLVLSNYESTHLTSFPPQVTLGD